MKQNRTRAALADAYLRLLNDYTIDRITVKMITDAVGCSRKTFYYYFTDVYVLTQYVFELRVQHFLRSEDVGIFEVHLVANHLAACCPHVTFAVVAVVVIAYVVRSHEERLCAHCHCETERSS